MGNQVIGTQTAVEIGIAAIINWLLFFKTLIKPGFAKAQSDAVKSAGQSDYRFVQGLLAMTNTVLLRCVQKPHSPP